MKPIRRSGRCRIRRQRARLRLSQSRIFLGKTYFDDGTFFSAKKNFFRKLRITDENCFQKEEEDEKKMGPRRISLEKLETIFSEKVFRPRFQRDTPSRYWSDGFL
jgi:hypothetical protein